MNLPQLGIVLVNYKRAEDTIECLESVLRSSVPVRVIVVDNGSGDGSLDTIAAWARGEHAATVADAAMAQLSTPPLPKPIAFARLSAAEAAATDPAALLTLIDAGGNVGFAAGNNIGLRHLLRDPALNYFWLLNNDTVIEPRAAGALVQRMATTHDIGMCGTVVRYYFRPDTVQALNGHRFNLWTGTSRGINNGQPAKASFDPAKVARETDFVLGASLAVSRPFLLAVGLMEEGYFLYYEEIDWAYRGGLKFKTAFAQGAVVFHKEGGSIGSSSVAGGRSTMSEYYLIRSRQKFVRRWHPLLLPVHLGLSASLILRRILRRQPAKAKAMTRAMFGLAYQG